MKQKVSVGDIKNIQRMHDQGCTIRDISEHLQIEPGRVETFFGPLPSGVDPIAQERGATEPASPPEISPDVGNMPPEVVEDLKPVAQVEGTRGKRARGK